MANFFSSVGYALGKLHSGMVVYLCELWNEGQREPLASFLGHFGISFKEEKIFPAREWNGIDLVIFSDQTGNLPLAVFEIKVDDYEHEVKKIISGKKEEGLQTIVYPKLLPNCPNFFFVTLGAGEYHHAPHCDIFRSIRIRDLFQAIESIQGKDHFITDWELSIGDEISLQDLAFKNDDTKMSKYRTGTWNIYVLGNLKETLVRDFFKDDLKIDPKIYMYGTRPDTILNFWWREGDMYPEINYNGKLNLKINLEGFKTESEKEELINNTKEKFSKKLSEFNPTISNRIGYGNSKTIMSFNIGLIQKEGNLYYGEKLDAICKRISEILRNIAV